MPLTSVNIVPTYSNIQILRPYAGFEADYEGCNPEQKKIICPGNLDANAGKDGYDPNLIGGAPVAYGSKVDIWFPRILNAYGQDVPDYYYRVIWRIRAFSEASGDETRRLQGHVGVRKAGRQQVGGGTGQPPQDAPRFVIPAAYETYQFAANVTRYDATEDGPLNYSPLGLADNQQLSYGTYASVGGSGSQGTADAINVCAAPAQFRTITNDNQDDVWIAPPTPGSTWVSRAGGPGPRIGHTRIVSQGFYDDNVGDTYDNAGFNGGPSHNIVSTIAKGDELIIEIFRNYRFPSGNYIDWSFENQDAGLSLFLGDDNGAGAIPNSGIYVISGM